MQNSPSLFPHVIPGFMLSRVVNIALVGAGGSGSQMLSGLARLDKALRGLDHPGLMVTLYDPDTVSEHNVGRQLFYPADVGSSKAAVLIHRVNLVFGLRWEAVQAAVGEKTGIYPADVLITCVDSAASRRRMWASLSKSYYHAPSYWLDLGPVSARWFEESRLLDQS